MTAADLRDIFRRVADLRVLVVGDVMLDNYWWGGVDRISPEAPVPVVTLERRESRLGGAANVALNCAALGAKVQLASVVGADVEGDALCRLCADAGIDTGLVQCSTARPTTTKTRVMGHHQQMLRIDAEMAEDLSTAEEHPFIDALLRAVQLQKPDVVIFEDYNKGVLKENVIRRTVEHSRQVGAVTAVDPKRKNFFSYRDVTLFKPNLKEVREGLNIPLHDLSKPALDAAQDELRVRLNNTVTLLTLSEAGVYFHDGQASAVLPAHLRAIADVSGAGDTVISVASIFYALTRDAALAAAVSNVAGGLVCEKVGVVPVDPMQLEQEVGPVLGVLP